MPVPLSQPDITAEEIAAVTRVLEGGRLSLGPELDAFEREFAAWTGTDHAVGVNSGTSGLDLALRVSDVGPGDEVITTPLSFVASANAIVYQGARPVFVDVEPDTLNLDPNRVEALIGPRTRAILVVHLFGRPARMGPLIDLARRHGLTLIEDACEAIGGVWEGRKLGSVGDLGVFAFYPNKQITTAEGGMIVGDDTDRIRRAAGLRSHGRRAGRGDLHVELGFNYRLSELHAAIGRVQLRRLDAILARREAVARGYAARLSGEPDLELPAFDAAPSRTSWFVYVVRLATRFGAADRDAILDGLTERGIGCSRYFPTIHLQPFYRERWGYAGGEFPVAESVAERTLALPFFNRIEEAQLDEVCDCLRELLSVRRRCSSV